MTVPSPFLMELPRDEMELEEFASIVEFWPEPVEMEPVRRPEKVSAARKTAPNAKLTTAAEMAGIGQLAAVSPDEFHQGMLVRHPEYGLGRIVALSGSGERRKATVDFQSRVGRKGFVLAMSPLRPVKR